MEGLGERLLSGRKTPRWRTQTQRDHDRLLYSSAFQRLGGITQVTASELGRPFHTRLTHTLKVAQVARRSAERLKQLAGSNPGSGPAQDLIACLDVDAAEAAALGHDLGHPPFGHLAEKVLHSKALRAGGFEGNPQSFRIVTRLALRGPHPGLDLSRQTLNGMLKYPWLYSAEHPKRSRKWGAYSSDERAFHEARQNAVGDERSLEACLMDWADDITYAVHDVDDFSRAGLILWTRWPATIVSWRVSHNDSPRRIACRRHSTLRTKLLRLSAKLWPMSTSGDHMKVGLRSGSPFAAWDPC